MSKTLFKLSPSDFKYLWEDCKHCYYRKIVFGIELPSIGMPGIFGKMSGHLQNALQGMNPHDLYPELPNGKFILKEGFLKSQPIGNCYINGRFDLLTEFTDGTHGLIDVKIVDQKESNLHKFERQLHAYKFALENPADGREKIVQNISKMGLLIVSPESININPGSNLTFEAKPVWMEIKIDMEKFFGYIKEVETVLSGPMPPMNPNCKWCKYRA